MKQYLFKGGPAYTEDAIHPFLLLAYIYSVNIYFIGPIDSVVKNLPANAGATGNVGLIPGLGRSPGEGNGKPLQYSCLGNSMDRGAWWATVHKVAKELDRT